METSTETAALQFAEAVAMRIIADRSNIPRVAAIVHACYEMYVRGLSS